jgi:hypothetical protein
MGAPQRALVRLIVTDFSPTVNFISLRITDRTAMSLLSVMGFSTNAKQQKVNRERE